MGVYIQGMEMPKNCHSCPMCLMRFCQAGDRELSERETRPNPKRPEDCPLVPVPPHGDLIDRDALVKSDRMVGKLMMYGGEYVYTQEEIDRAPTIIEAEEGET